MAAYLSILLLLTACNNPTMSFRWNDLEEYGTYYPAELKELTFALNGKGFGATDGVAELWADASLVFLPHDESPESDITDDEEEPVVANFYLQGRKGPECIEDNILENNGIRERIKTVVYDDWFYTVSYTYPVDQSEHYQPYEAAIFDDFPVLRKPRKIGMLIKAFD